MLKIIDARTEFVPTVVKGDLANEMYAEITRPANSRQINALKKAMLQRVQRQEHLR